MSIKLLGRTAADSRTVTFFEPLSMVLSRRYDSPAEQLEITFPFRGEVPDLTDIQVSHDADILFRGYCDEVIRASDDGGATVTISARSPGSYLLDNEAKPGEYQNLTARAYFNEALAPFGFKELTVPDESKRTASFTVAKGRSVWEAFTLLCFRLYGREPRITPTLGIAVGALPSEATMFIGNDPSADAARYCSLEYITRRSSALSEIVFRNRSTSYNQSLANPFGNPLKVRRRRYVIPIPEYYNSAANLDPYRRILHGELGVHSARVSLPRLYNVFPGRVVGLTAPQCGEQLLAVYGSKSSITRPAAAPVWCWRTRSICNSPRGRKNPRTCFSVRGIALSKGKLIRRKQCSNRPAGRPRRPSAPHLRGASCGSPPQLPLPAPWSRPRRRGG